MAQKMESNSLHLEIWMLIGNTRDMIFRLREKELLETCGLYIREAGVLMFIDAINRDGKEATPAELARRTLRKPNTTGYILERMEKRGLIKQTRDLERKNLIKVVMTEKGKQSYMCAQRRESISKIMQNLSDEELLTLKPILEKLRTALYGMSGKNQRR